MPYAATAPAGTTPHVPGSSAPAAAAAQGGEDAVLTPQVVAFLASRAPHMLVQVQQLHAAGQLSQGLLDSLIRQVQQQAALASAPPHAVPHAPPQGQAHALAAAAAQLQAQRLRLGGAMGLQPPPRAGVPLGTHSFGAPPGVAPGAGPALAAAAAAAAAALRQQQGGGGGPQEPGPGAAAAQVDPAMLAWLRTQQ
jgi:hypothetical protein